MAREESQREGRGRKEGRQAKREGRQESGSKWLGGGGEVSANVTLA